MSQQSEWPPQSPPRVSVPPVIGSQTPGESKLGVGAGGKRINLVKLAQAQRAVIWCILARVVLELSFIGMRTLPGPGGVGAGGPAVAMMPVAIYGFLTLGVTIVTVVFIVRAASAYGYNTVMAVLGGLVTVLGCIGLIVLLLLNQRITTTLQRAGVTVGLMGVGAAELNKLKVGVCSGCGYPLVGLTGGRCPECGTPLAASV